MMTFVYGDSDCEDLWQKLLQYLNSMQDLSFPIQNKSMFKHCLNQALDWHSEPPIWNWAQGLLGNGFQLQWFLSAKISWNWHDSEEQYLVSQCIKGMREVWLCELIVLDKQTPLLGEINTISSAWKTLSSSNTKTESDVVNFIIASYKNTFDQSKLWFFCPFIPNTKFSL